MNDVLMNDDDLIKSLNNINDLVVSWHFFEILSSSININDTDASNDKYTINEKYKKKLIHFVQYDKNIVKHYKKEYNEPLSKEYFKTLGTTLLKDDGISIHNFKTVPIVILKNIVIVGILFINNTIKHPILDTHNILYKKLFLVDLSESITRFNNINIIKGIINSPFNKEYLDDNIKLINNYETVCNKTITSNCSLLYLLNIIQKYSCIFEFKI